MPEIYGTISLNIVPNINNQPSQNVWVDQYNGAQLSHFC
ncbi:hypothetical protein VCR1J2_190055 [Vibrio coralliirubri]|nr:hypothetical protein VCR1J2_190055 [Vibrio coralliirubri]CDU08858.1 hypothetical protein VCR8J2_50072 [Vibrio coralliirubri]